MSTQSELSRKVATRKYYKSLHKARKSLRNLHKAKKAKKRIHKSSRLLSSGMHVEIERKSLSPAKFTTVSGNQIWIATIRDKNGIVKDVLETRDKKVLNSYIKMIDRSYR